MECPIRTTSLGLCVAFPFDVCFCFFVVLEIILFLSSLERKFNDDDYSYNDVDSQDWDGKRRNKNKHRNSEEKRKDSSKNSNNHKILV